MAQQATFGTWFAPLRDGRSWKLFAYLLSTYPIGMFWFIFSVVGVSAGVPLLIVWVGIPILAGVLFVWRFGARLERTMANVFGGVEIASPYQVSESQGALERLRSQFADPATWRDALYLLLLFPLGIVALVVVILAISVPGSLLAAPFVYWIPDFDLTYFQVGSFSIQVDQLWEAMLAFVVGVFIAPLTLRLAAAVGRARVHLAANLLGPTKSSALDAQVETLQFSQARGFDAAESERKRIERDLHDGAQQRLVALAMELGRAKEKMAQDPAEAERLVGVAHDHAKTAIVELRDLARGFTRSSLRIGVSMRRCQPWRVDRLCRLRSPMTSIIGRSPPLSQRPTLWRRKPSPTSENTRTPLGLELPLRVTAQHFASVSKMMV